MGLFFPQNDSKVQFQIFPVFRTMLETSEEVWVAVFLPVPKRKKTTTLMFLFSAGQKKHPKHTETKSCWTFFRANLNASNLWKISQRHSSSHTGEEKKLTTKHCMVKVILICRSNDANCRIAERVNPKKERFWQRGPVLVLSAKKSEIVYCKVGSYQL